MRRGRVQKGAASFTSEGSRTATVCFGESIEFLKANLPKWRSVAVARSPSLRERCACWVYAQPWVRSLLLTSRSKSRRLWMQRSIKKKKKSHTIHATPWWCGAHLMADPASVTYEQFLSAAATLRVPAARLLLVYWTNSWLFLNRHEDNAEHSTNMQCMHQ